MHLDMYISRPLSWAKNMYIHLEPTYCILHIAYFGYIFRVHMTPHIGVHMHTAYRGILMLLSSIHSETLTAKDIHLTTWRIVSTPTNDVHDATTRAGQPCRNEE